MILIGQFFGFKCRYLLNLACFDFVVVLYFLQINDGGYECQVEFINCWFLKMGLPLYDRFGFRSGEGLES